MATHPPLDKLCTGHAVFHTRYALPALVQAPDPSLRLQLTKPSRLFMSLSAHFLCDLSRVLHSRARSRRQLSRIQSANLIGARDTRLQLVCSALSIEGYAWVRAAGARTGFQSQLARAFLFIHHWEMRNS
uniref:Uncharacterized protein n=1 Tax=Hyaloperonospora arabidopsidis (strain Emoy2) TaxID=559515 RepID=M4BJ30_HYAAE